MTAYTPPDGTENQYSLAFKRPFGNSNVFSDKPRLQTKEITENEATDL